MIISQSSIFRSIGGLVCACLTISCGGNEPSTGVLIDGPVSGIPYETDTLSGVTDEEGTFEYFEGEMVRFFLGGTTLGQSPGQAQVSPFDLAGIEPPLDDDDFNAVEESGDLFRAVNIAFLLQTLDRNGSADDGIEISAEVAALFEGVEVDLDRDPERFRTDHDFRRILNQANEQSLFPAYRAIADLVAVMQHLYATLQIELMLTRPASVSRDEDADEMADLIQTVEYDDTGRLIAIRFDEDADGIPERFIELQYDERGLAIGGFNDQGGMVETVTIVYDMDHNLVRIEIDANDDGILDEITEREYNEFGELVAERDDNDGDGVVDRIVTRQYDERGNEVLEATDNNADGVNDSLFSQQYDAQDRLVRQDSDSDANGVSERTTIFEYDEDGNQVRTAIDSDVDGMFDIDTTRTFDANGNITRSETDNDGDGMPNSIQTRQYDATGNLTLQQDDDDADGTVDRTQTNTYDGDGNLIRSEFDDDGDSIADRVINQTAFDARGNVLRVENDENGDGVIDSITTSTYTTAGWGSVYRALL